MTLQFNFPKNDVPPDYLRFHHSDGHVSLAADVTAWYAKIAKHERDNGRTLPEDWKEQAQDQLCRVLPPGWCKFSDGSAPKTYVDVRLTMAGLLRGMATLTEVVVSSDSLVDQSEAERRAKICAACPANVSFDGCAPCVGFSNKIVAIKGAHSTEADPLLKACAICLCSNKAQVWVKGDVLAKRITPEMREQFSALPWCWKREV